MTFRQERRIVVMGGSFNPPTIAHLRLMEAAVQAVGAEMGIFVPVGGAYLKRKMRKSEDHIRLKEQLRLDMLNAMCKGNEKLIVSDVEILNPLMYTRETMHALQEEYPEAKLHFIAGADKLPLLGNMAGKSDFFEHFSVVLFAREGMDTQALVRQDTRFAPYEAPFVHAVQPEGVDGISSTAVRKLIASRETDRARDLLHEDVWKMVCRLAPEDFPPEIERFQEEYAFLSNNYPAPVRHEGMVFSCAEAAFQAAGCALPADKKRIAQGDGGRAKQIAYKSRLLPDWEEKKLAVMEEILRLKFAQNPELARKLADTGNAILIYGSSGKNNYWGRDLYTDRGENHLGELLMKLREELQRDMKGE